MKTTFLLLIATVLSGCNGQFSDLCISQPMREVPITLQIKRASDLPACGEDGLLAIPELASYAEEQIVNRYQPPSLSFNCSLVDLQHTSCESLGRRGQRILIHYKANLTCGDECFHLNGFDQNELAAEFYYDQFDSLLSAARGRPNSQFFYDDRLIDIFYFRGRKGSTFSTCSGTTIQNGVNKKIPACSCPSVCPDPCTLPPMTGNCRASIPQYYHDSASGRCEMFTYGGCGGNQNRFATREECERACKVCPSGKEYQECGSSCPTTCENKDDLLRPCTLQCVQDCFCPAGTVELGDRCVAPEECPSTQAQVLSTPPVDQQECPEGMVYRECGTACPTTCDNKDDIVGCIQVCVPGCFCEDNEKVLLDEEGQTCVSREECPVKDQECPEGKIYKECGTACPVTCENKNESIFCIHQCVAGCFCPPGTVEKGDTCVTPEKCDSEVCSLPPVTGLCLAYFPRYFYNSTSDQCEMFVYGGCGGNDNNFETIEACEAECKAPNTTPSPVDQQECPKGMVYRECGTACPTTCDNKDDTVVCFLVCVPGCFCDGDAVLLEEGGEECVAREECPSTQAQVLSTPPPVDQQECPEGMVYKECGTACPTTCDNKDDNVGCIFVCVPGCFCEDDEKVLLDEEGQTCVSREECPVKDQECPEGKIYKECGTACPVTCENKNESIFCIHQCVASCFCPPGTVEKGDSCVTPEECDSEVCSLSPEVGPCKAAFRRYFYNSTSDQCEQFIYGGCQGNDNNFETIEECEAECRDTGVKVCPHGKEYQECGSSCPTTCENKDDVHRPCTLQCVQGCFCPAGTVEKGDLCVTPEECDSEVCSLPPVTGLCRAYFPRYFYNSTSEQCEMFIYGGCGGNDNNFETIKACEAECKAPNTTPPPVDQQECPKGMVYRECGTACPTTCDNKDDTVVCFFVCVPGCFCDGDTVLLEEGGEECVAREECPAKEPDQDCPVGMVYNECGTSCPTTCDNKDELVSCTEQCVQGCFCNGSTVLLEEGGEECVDRDECPVKEECPEGMVYRECGTDCPTTCDNKDELTICTFQCVPGCFCDGDTVLLEEEGDECVAREECPAKEPDQDYGE